MTFLEAKSLREYQLNGGRVSEAELQEAIRVLSSRPKNANVSTDIPWDLSPGMIEALSAYIETGSPKGAADRLCANPKTVWEQLKRAADRIGVDNVILAALALDRHNNARNM